MTGTDVQDAAAVRNYVARSGISVGEAGRRELAYGLTVLGVGRQGLERVWPTDYGRNAPQALEVRR